MNLTARVKSFFQPKRGPRRIPAPPEAAGRVHPIIKAIVERLGSQGFNTLVVGGAVRDLLLGRSPRDFDLASDARPEQVKRLFSNARIIGRRFRLVHLTYPDMTVELSTFRASAPRTKGGMILRDNIYGTPEEDAFRRDFTVNALAYDIVENEVIDYVGGLADLELRTLRTITPAHVSLREDPVRMLRAVRFKVGLDFAVEPELERVMRRMAPHLLKVKRHRLAEETQRFLTRGAAAAIFGNLQDFGLLPPMLGQDGYKWFFDDDALQEPLPRLSPYLEALDRWVGEGRETPSATVALLGLLIALARPEIRASLLGQAQPKTTQQTTQQTQDDTPHRTRQKPGGNDAPNLRKIQGDLRSMLGNWGLLKGQVQPALQILEAVRLLLKQGLKHGLSHSQKQGLEHGPEHGLKPPDKTQGKAPPPGTREAWQLLALLRQLLGLPANTPETALREMAALPVLPIFDHMPRGPGSGGRSRGSRRRSSQHSNHRKGGPAKTETSSDKQPAGPSASRRRRSRRPRRARNQAQL